MSKAVRVGGVGEVIILHGLPLLEGKIEFPICYSKLQGKKVTLGAGEMAQWLRALPAPSEVLSSIPSNHMVAHIHLQWEI